MKRGLDLSPVTEVLIEESLLGLERVRDGSHARTARTTAFIICSIRKFRPNGRPHRATRSPSAPAQTLTDKEYQIMRDASFAVIREIGVETGGSNIQFSRRSQDRAA